MFQEMQVAGVGGGTNATLLWENPDTTNKKLAAGVYTIPNLDSYDLIIFEMYAETDYDTDPKLGYSGFQLSQLSAQKAVGFANYYTYIYCPYRLVQHTGTNELTISTGHYFRAGSSDNTSTGYGVFMKIYGIKL